ncbi:MAG: stalk domain-containing protein, partial [Gammaproteobacteria bacterium]
MYFVRFTILALFLFSVSGLARAADEAPENWTPRDDDLRILEMRVEQYRLEDVLATYQRKDMLLVPMGALAEILDLAVDVNPGDGTAQGFMFKEDNTIYLDTSRNEVTISGNTQSYNGQLVYVLDDDIYVDANLLARWFDISIDADLFSSTVKIRSEEPFPFIIRMEREERIAKTRARLAAEQPYYPHHYEPYDMWNIPFIDQTFEGTRRQGDGQSTNTFRSTTYATTDLLGMESS